MKPVVVHFWTPRAVPQALESWQPDDEPALFADGRGHAFYELYVRFKFSGLAVSIGQHVPREAAVVVVFAKDLSMTDSLAFVLSASHLPCVLIESDWPTSLRIPIRATISVRSNSYSRTSAAQTVIPLLPQRGLVKRAPERSGSIATVGYKGDPLQAPAFVRSEGFSEALLDMGLSFIGSDLVEGKERWHDFSGTDVVLCMRSGVLQTSHKPPTKLINAWAAGCVPLVGREPAYLELVTDRHDGLVVTDEPSVLAALQELQKSPELRRSLEQGIAQKSVEFSRDQILRAWKDVAMRASERGPRPRASSAAAAILRWSSAQIANLHFRAIRRLRQFGKLKGHVDP